MREALRTASHLLGTAHLDRPAWMRRTAVVSATGVPWAKDEQGVLGGLRYVEDPFSIFMTREL